MGYRKQHFRSTESKYGGMAVSEARRLNGLENENGCLKKLLADKMLYNVLLRDIAAKKSPSMARSEKTLFDYCESTVRVSAGRARSWQWIGPV